ncbi:MAG TPA: EamA family transporter [Devosia sp.]|nr:EamA family transporter [Devosia sp.]
MKSLNGMLFCASGIVLMCCMDAVAKALGADLTTFQVVFLRYLGAAIWLILWIALTGASWPKKADLGRQAQRAALLVVTASLFFYAVTHLPLAVVAALGMTAPVYVTLLGAIFFREKIGPFAWLALGLGAAGSATIIFAGRANPFGAVDGDALAWAAALLAPLTYAVVVALLKHHSGREDPAAMTMGQSLLAAIFVSPLALGAWPAITPEIAGLGTLIGLLGAVGFLLLINGLRRVPVSVFAVLDYTALIWAGLLGFFFFSEIPGPQLWLGGSLIIAACILNTRRAAQPQTAG